MELNQAVNYLDNPTTERSHPQGRYGPRRHFMVVGSSPLW